MPIYRKTSGGVFAPVSSLSVSSGGEVKKVAIAWVSHGGVFKQVFPDPTPEDAADSPLYNTEGAAGGLAPSYWGSTPVTWVIQSTSPEGYTFLPFADGVDHEITRSTLRVQDVNGNIIQTSITGNLVGTAGTSSADFEPTDLKDSQDDLLSSGSITHGTTTTKGIVVKNQPKLRYKSYPPGTVVQMSWEWIAGGRGYYYTFPPYTLKV